MTMCFANNPPPTPPSKGAGSAPAKASLPCKVKPCFTQSAGSITCGPSSVKNALSRLGKSAEAGDLMKEMQKIPGGWIKGVGASPTGIAGALNNHGVNTQVTDVSRMQLEDYMNNMQATLAGGNPVIALGDLGAYNHYILVDSVTGPPGNRMVRVCDPETGAKVMTQHDFLQKYSPLVVIGM